jgi:hypothetical protein
MTDPTDTSGMVAGRQYVVGGRTAEFQYGKLWYVSEGGGRLTTEVATGIPPEKYGLPQTGPEIYMGGLPQTSKSYIDPRTGVQVTIYPKASSPAIIEAQRKGLEGMTGGGLATTKYGAVYYTSGPMKGVTIGEVAQPAQVMAESRMRELRESPVSYSGIGLLSSSQLIRNIMGAPEGWEIVKTPMPERTFVTPAGEYVSVAWGGKPPFGSSQVIGGELISYKPPKPVYISTALAGGGERQEVWLGKKLMSSVSYPEAKSPLEEMFPLTTAVSKGFDIMFAGAARSMEINKLFVSEHPVFPWSSELYGATTETIFGGAKAAYTFGTGMVTLPLDITFNIATKPSPFFGVVAEPATSIISGKAGEFYTPERTVAIAKAGVVFASGYIMGIGAGGQEPSIGRTVFGIGAMSVATGQNPVVLTAGLGGGALGAEEISYLFKGMTPSRLAVEREEIFKAGYERYIEKNIPKVEFVTKTPLGEWDKVMFEGYKRTVAFEAAMGAAEPISQVSMTTMSKILSGPAEGYYLIGKGFSKTALVNDPLWFGSKSYWEIGMEHTQMILTGKGAGIKKGGIESGEYFKQEYVDVGDLAKGVMRRGGYVYEDIGGGVWSLRAREYTMGGAVLEIEGLLKQFGEDIPVKVSGVTGQTLFSYRITGGGMGGVGGKEGLLYKTLGIVKGEPRVWITKEVTGFAELNLFEGTANLFRIDTGISEVVPIPAGKVMGKLSYTAAIPKVLTEYIPSSELRETTTMYGGRGGGVHTPWSVTLPEYVDFMDFGTSAGVTVTKGVAIGDIGIPFVAPSGEVTVAQTATMGAFAIPLMFSGRQETKPVSGLEMTGGIGEKFVVLGRTAEQVKPLDFTTQGRGVEIERVISGKQFVGMPTALGLAGVQMAKTIIEQPIVTKEVIRDFEQLKSQQKEMQMLSQVMPEQTIQEEAFEPRTRIRFVPEQPPPPHYPTYPPLPKFGGLAEIKFPKSKILGGMGKFGRGGPNPLADILSVQRTQVRFGGRATQLPITKGTLAKWRMAAGGGFGRGFPTRELERMPKAKARKIRIFGKRGKRRRRVI